MFSANENIVLRQHKRRIIQHVEGCLPEDVLDAGTMVMVMEVSCRAPGCVPLETMICVVFPKVTKELLPGLAESKGGQYKTKVLKPMSEVTQEDVLEALPPEFPGGLRSTEKLCLQARDVMLAQITQLMGEGDLEGRRLMAAYLQSCLNEYVERNCVAPEYGEPFAPLERDASGESEDKVSNGGIRETGNFVVRRAIGEEDAPRVLDTGVKQDSPDKHNVLIHRVVDNDATNTSSVAKKDSPKSGNAVIHRAMDKEALKTTKNMNKSDAAVVQNTVVHRAVEREDKETLSNGATNSSSDATNSATATKSMTDWKRQQNIDKTMTSQSIISQLAEREHAPGVRRPGCPCCDPDNPNNYVDSMMML